MQKKNHSPKAFLIFIAILILVFFSLNLPLFAKEQVISFWNTFGTGLPKEAVDGLVDQFNRQNKGKFRVQMFDVMMMEQKILTATAGNVAPDIALFDRFRIATFAERGAFRNIKEIYPRLGLKPEDFFDPCFKECVYKEGIYALPFNTDVRVLFYNRKIFRENGLDPDRPPKNWKELKQYAEKLTLRDENGRLKRIGFSPVHGNSWLYLYGWQKGGKFVGSGGKKITFTDPKIVDALQWMVNVCDIYGIKEMDRFATGFGSEAFYPFLSGKCAMDCQEGYLLSMIRRYTPDLDFMVAPMPWPSDGVHATWSGGFALVFPKGSKNFDAALQFGKFMVSRESQVYYGKKSEQIPALKKAGYDDYFMQDPCWKVFIDEMNYSKFRPVSPIGDLMFDQLARARDFATHKKMTPYEALAQGQKECQAEYERILKKYDYPLAPWKFIMPLLILPFAIFFIIRVRRSLKIIQGTRLHRREMINGYLFALPVFLGLLIFTVGPIIASVIFSFCHYDILTPSRWLGFENYQRLFTDDPLFFKSLANTVIYTAMSVPFGVIMALVLALLLNREFRGRSVFRTLFFVPSVIPIVAASVLWVWLYNGEYGLINHMLRKIGLPGLSWLQDEHLAKPAIVLMGIWSVGGGMIICLAGLQGIPRHLYEAAQIDGAGPWQKFIHITIPMLSPTLFFLIVIGFIGSFQIFTQAYVMTDGTGGPLDATLFYVFYLYRQGFVYFSMGYASAMAWLLVIIIAFVSFIQFKLSSKWVHYGG